MRVVLGRVVGAHGVRGAVRVRWFGDGPDNLLRQDRIWCSERESDEASAARGFNVQGGGSSRAGEVRLDLEGIDDRDAAAALRGHFVFGDASRLERLEDDEFYWYELIGFRVETGDGTAVGTVKEIWETGAHDVLVVAPDPEDAAAGAKDRLIPTARDILTEIDREARRIRIESLPGLLDLD